MIDDLLNGLLSANLAAAAAIGVVALLRRPVRRRFGAKAAYRLWIVPVLAAAGALVPAEPGEGAAAELMLTTADAAGTVLKTAADAGVDPALWLAALWAAGAVAAAGLLAWRQGRYVRMLGTLTPLPERPHLLVSQFSTAGPALVGALRPRLILPADFEGRFDPAEQAVIIAHEEAHLRAGDPLINAVAAAVQCLAWFNPAVHLGARLLRIDQELACDAAVLAARPGVQRLYAETLLKSQLADQPLPLGCHWPTSAQHPLKERIAMLKSPSPAFGRRLAGLALVGGLSAAAACAAWAAAPAEPQLITAPDWISRPSGSDLATLYPAAAKAKGEAGKGMIECRITAEGTLNACTVVKEEPLEAGFGPATVALADKFRMAPLSKDGVATAGGKIRIPVLWRAPGAK
ncbi:TonB family protein [Caulobacter segnis]|uniref:TonB family protein n=1 Tax=Caulobacter segnis TaxID=88688 RepID=UPI00240FC84D|nr:TonB family protein [Caulobacter segnis]MDG2523311.1 TonB family protein [Caulobacter segnis]